MRPTPTVTVSVDLDDCAMMNEADDGCDSDGGIGEDLVPSGGRCRTNPQYEAFAERHRDVGAAPVVT